MKKVFLLILVICFLVSCSDPIIIDGSDTDEGRKKNPDGKYEKFDVSAFDFTFSANDVTPTSDLSCEVISFDGESVYCGSSVTKENKSVIITKAGSYRLNGETESKNVIINAPDEKVYLFLNGVDITSPDGPCIYVKNAKKVYLTVCDGTENKFEDKSDYSESFKSGKPSPDACIYADSDLVINGNGKISVNGLFGHGIVSKNDLVICGTTLEIYSKSTGILGYKSVKIKDADITVSSGTDGIKSDNVSDDGKGFIYVESGSFNVKSSNDSFQSSNLTKIIDGTFNLKAGGGISKKGKADTSKSHKCLKSFGALVIDGGTFDLDSAEDTIHTKNNIEISGGDFCLSSGDDAVHSDTFIYVSDGKIDIKESYEGLESVYVEICGGNVFINSSDDGINASSSDSFDGDFGNKDRMPGGPMGGTSNADVTFNGGYVLINASGDGIDSNGTINMLDGVVLISGPTSSGDTAFDFETNANISGGVLVALGSNGMIEVPTNVVNQGCITSSFNGIDGLKTFAVVDSDGNLIVSFTPEKSYSGVVVSTPNLKSGKTYYLIYGCDVSDADSNGYSVTGTVTGGTEIKSVTLDNLNYSDVFGGGMPGGPGIQDGPGIHGGPNDPPPMPR